MLVVSFDIATEKMYLVLENDCEIIKIHHNYTTPERYNSAVLITDMIKVLEENDFKPEEIGAIAINKGPGSFTGIRAAAVVARTMGQFLKVPVIGVSSLEIYANACKTDKEKFLILDAKRAKWYIGHYGSDNIEITGPELKLSSEVIEFIKDKDYQIITEQSMMEELKEYSPTDFKELTEDFGAVLAKLARKRIENSLNPSEDFAWYKLEPTYLQTPSISTPKKRIIIQECC